MEIVVMDGSLILTLEVSMILFHIQRVTKTHSMMGNDLEEKETKSRSWMIGNP